MVQLLRNPAFLIVGGGGGPPIKQELGLDLTLKKKTPDNKPNQQNKNAQTTRKPGVRKAHIAKWIMPSTRLKTGKSDANVTIPNPDKLLAVGLRA